MRYRLARTPRKILPDDCTDVTAAKGLLFADDWAGVEPRPLKKPPPNPVEVEAVGGDINPALAPNIGASPVPAPNVELLVVAEDPNTEPLVVAGAPKTELVAGAPKTELLVALGTPKTDPATGATNAELLEVTAALALEAGRVPNAELLVGGNAPNVEPVVEAELVVAEGAPKTELVAEVVVTKGLVVVASVLNLNEAAVVVLVSNEVIVVEARAANDDSPTLTEAEPDPNVRLFAGRIEVVVTGTVPNTEAVPNVGLSKAPGKENADFETEAVSGSVLDSDVALAGSVEVGSHQVVGAVTPEGSELQNNEFSFKHITHTFLSCPYAEFKWVKTPRAFRITIKFLKS